jgi:hypothetical protein
MLHMTHPEEAVKPKPCERHGENVGITPLSPPTKVLMRYRAGAEVEMDFIGWDVVFAWVMQDGMTAIRDGHRVILTDSYWAAQIWGRG